MKKKDKTSRQDDDYLKMAVQASALAFDVDSEDVLGRRRPEPLVFARQTAYYLLRCGVGYPYTRAGVIFGVDHGTILHGVNKVQDVLDLDLNRKHRNGSWADKVRLACKYFGRFHKAYVESDFHQAMKEVDYAIQPS
tara:strand:+ start:337 stop:747 length:411 start_codon:yes stop_codon:yes gene_type:complete